ncbi:hypothetical protein [Paenibacillus koleovorans]|uniref:hypothetical protein n=1 Tax=Paenibacillus koleovorans TaxID=121608 RepID=UPI000FDBD103|nr:hypothetical protein [Paenibacillus koleovorans]
MQIGSTTLSINGMSLDKKLGAGVPVNLAVQIVNNQLKQHAEQEKLNQQLEAREKQLLLNAKDGPWNKQAEASLIDRGISVVRGIYDAFQRSVATSREQYIDPMLDEMAEYEKRLEDVKANADADPSEAKLLESEIDFLRGRIQETTDWFMEQYEWFYGGFLRGTEAMYNQATNGQFGRVLSHYLRNPDGLQGLLELSAKGLDLDDLQGSSTEIRHQFDKANERLEQFQETLEKAQKKFREAKGLQDSSVNESLKLMMRSEQLELLDQLLVRANAGAFPDQAELERIQGIQDVRVEYSLQPFDRTV